MKRILILLLWAIVLVSCGSKDKTCLRLHEYVYTDGEFDMVAYSDARWAVIPSDVDDLFEVFLLDGDEESLERIVCHINDEIGPFDYDHTTLPADITTQHSAVAAFRLPDDRALEEGESMYWWVLKEAVVRLYIYDSIDDMVPSFAVLSVFHL